MSLVGSEVDVSFEQDYSRPVVSDDELSTTESRLQSEDHHPPPSPPRPAERLFLNDLVTQNISAAALAQQIHQSQRYSSGWTGTSVNTDDFVSAIGWGTSMDEADSFLAALHPISARTSDTLTPFAESDDDDDSDCYEDIFQKDVLSRNYHNPISEVNEDTYHDSNMATTTAPATTSTATPGTKFFPTEAPTHVDAAEKVYDTAKGIWAWGKGVTIVKPFLGLAEGVAGKIAGMAGSNLGTLDGAVIDQLHGLDDKVLNPAITAIVGVLLGAAGKTEDVLKPIIIAILKPLGLIKNTAETPELTTVPGVKVQ